jgi:hypothetical protein
VRALLRATLAALTRGRFGVTQHRKHRGYESQRIVARYFAANGWPYAEPVGAGRTGSDVTGMPGLDIEVKARRGLDMPALLRQLGERAERELLGFGVLRLDGQGPASIHEWPVVLRLDDFTALLRAAGYGTLQEES